MSWCRFKNEYNQSRPGSLPLKTSALISRKKFRTMTRILYASTGNPHSAIVMMSNRLFFYFCQQCWMTCILWTHTSIFFPFHWRLVWMARRENICLKTYWKKFWTLLLLFVNCSLFLLKVKLLLAVLLYNLDRFDFPLSSCILSPIVCYERKPLQKRSILDRKKSVGLLYTFFFVL